MKALSKSTRPWAYCFILLLWLTGCEPLYHSFAFREPARTRVPMPVAGDEVWITSVPVGADVYLRPYDPEVVPFHADSPEAYRGKTPLHISLPPGGYLVEVALDVAVFSNYFSPPYDDAQFEGDGAVSEAILFKPFSPGDEHRMLRYYRLEKTPHLGEVLIALFHPRGTPLERMAALYPPTEQFEVGPEALYGLLQQLHIPASEQGPLLTLLRRGGKVVWSQQDSYRVALEVGADTVQVRIVTLYTGVALPKPLLPDGGGF